MRRDEIPRESMIQRAVDWIFGYDFFISYSHRDGLGYPRHLKERLGQIGFKVFLDQTEFTPGIELRREARRQVAKSSKLVVIGRSFALKSAWVLREVQLALSFGKTPVIIDVNRAVETADERADLVRLARDKDWLRVNEVVTDADGEPSDHATAELIRSFRHTRQERKRLQTFAVAAGIFAIVAGLAVWQGIEAFIQRNLAVEQQERAEANERQAINQRNSALRTQSRFLADLAHQQLSGADFSTGMLLALEGIPDRGDRPYVPEAEHELDAGLRELREAHIFTLRGQYSSAEISPDGRRVAIFSGDEKIWLLDAETGKEIALLNQGSELLDYRHFSPDGQRILGIARSFTQGQGGVDFTARIWDAYTGKELTIFSGHETWIRDMALSPDGRLLATGSEDGTTRLWDVKTAKLLGILRHNATESWVVFSPDAKLLATYGEKTVRIWDVKTRRQLAILAGHQDELSSVAFMSDGKRVLTASRDKTVRLWQAETGKQIAILDRKDTLERVWFTPNAERVLTLTKESAKLWDTSTLKQLAEIRGGYGETAVFSPDGHWILLPSADATARLWDAETGKEVKVLSGHTNQIVSGAFTSNGKRVMTASKDGTARLWNTETGQQAVVLKGHRGPLRKAGLSQDGSRVLTLSDDDTAQVWDAQVRRGPLVLEGRDSTNDSSRRMTANFCAGGQRVVTTSLGGIAKLWDTQTGAEIGTISDGSSVVDGVSCAPNGRMVSVAYKGNSVRLVDAGSGAELAVLEGHKDVVRTTEFSRDGKWMVSGSADHTARVWDVATGKNIATLSGHEKRLISASFSSDSLRVLTVSEDGTARLWDWQTGREITVLSGRELDFFESGTFSPDGQRIVTAASYRRDSEVILWDGKDGTLVRSLEGHEHDVTGAVFSPTSQRLVSMSRDYTARLWNARSGELIGVLQHSDAVYSATFSPDGHHVVTASGDGKAGVWDAETGTSIATLVGHERIVWTATFSPDGRRIVTASQDNTARVWDAETGKEIATLKGPAATVESADFGPDGTRVLTISSDNSARIWHVFSRTEDLVDYTRKAVPRCLTTSQRKEAFLDPEPPVWCIEMEKWPYDTDEWKQWLTEKNRGLSPPAPGDEHR
jgi:WD40 repeat protein